jgi:hypothetical protein
MYHHSPTTRPESVASVRRSDLAVLRIEHPVPDFEAWQAAFGRDPVARERSGVRRYRILRPIDDPNYVMIDLELDTPQAAEALLGALRRLWRDVQGTIMDDPRARIVEVVEDREY